MGQMPMQALGEDNGEGNKKTDEKRRKNDETSIPDPEKTTRMILIESVPY